MRENDFDAFASLLDDVAEVLPRPGQQLLSGTAKAMYFRALASHDFPAVRGALDAHVRDAQRGRFFPSPADLIAQLEGAAADDGRLGAEEAWSVALGAADERSTVVWTDDIAAAWAACKPVFSIGDEVGARMAFREVYARVVGEARKRREPLTWRVSIGFDSEQRRVAIEAAVHAGRLPVSELHALPAPDAGLVPLLTWPSRSPVAEQARQTLRELADLMRAGAKAIPVSTVERDRLNSRKAEIDQRVRAHMEQRKSA